MIVSPESVATYKAVMTAPKENGFYFPALSEIFEESKTAIAAHTLFTQYRDLVKCPVPKVFFYIVMNDLYKQGWAECGNGGYYVSFRKSSSGQ